MSSFLKTIDDAIKSAVYQKFDEHFELETETTGIVFAPKQVAQRMLAEKRGDASVEFLSIWRGPGQLEYDWGRQNTAVARKGLAIQYADSNTKEAIITVKAIPAKMKYDIWFWSRNLDKINSAVETWLKWKQDFPNLVLNYSNVYPMEMYMKLGNPVDESNYDIYNKGKYYVVRMPLELEGWVLTSMTSKTILTIILDIYIRSGDPVVDTLVAEYTVTVDDSEEAIVTPTYPAGDYV